MSEANFTFVEWVKTDDLDFEVTVKGHLPEDILTKSGFSCSWASSNSD